nr:Chain P, Envelope polyprotein GP160 [synthetic construct]1TZG_Q Chain Q, Envelope polyprotein GP160 [synthetic construct]
KGWNWFDITNWGK